MSSLDRILPFLRPIEDLLRDPAITEVMVNCGGRRVFVERSGSRKFRAIELGENSGIYIKVIAPYQEGEGEGQKSYKARLRPRPPRPIPRP